MAVRGKERLTDNNSEVPSSGDSSVSEVCLEVAGETLGEKQTARGRMLLKCKKSSPRHSVASRKLSGNCIVKENHCVATAVCQTEQNSAA